MFVVLAVLHRFSPYGSSTKVSTPIGQSRSKSVYPMDDCSVVLGQDASVHCEWIFLWLSVV